MQARYRLIPRAGRLLPKPGPGQARAWPGAVAGLLTGGCLGYGYGFLAGLPGGDGPATREAAIGAVIGLVTGALAGFLTGRARSRRRIPRPGPQARIWPWSAAGLLTGGCLGCGYGFTAGLPSGAGYAGLGAVIGAVTGLAAGSLTGSLAGLAQVLLGQTPIPVPVVAVAATELILLPLQLLAAGISRQTADIFIYLPSMLAITTAAALGLLLPPAKPPLLHRSRPEPGTPPRATPGNSAPADRGSGHAGTGHASGQDAPLPGSEPDAMRKPDD